MAKIVALFDDRMEAERAQQDLLREGIGMGAIDLISHEKRPEEGRGTWDRIKEFFGMEVDETDIYDEATRRGGTLLAVTCDDLQADRVIEAISRYRPVDMDRRTEEWRQSGWARQGRVGYPGEAPASSVQTAPGAGLSREERWEDHPSAGIPVSEEAKMGESRPAMSAWTGGTEQRIPIAEEKLRIGKAEVRKGGIRVYTRVVERPVEEGVTLREEHATVERRPVDRPAGEEAFQERTIETREVREEPVVGKEARVVEEVVVGKEVRERTETVRDTVRRTEVEIESLENEFRSDFQSRYSMKGGSYEQYQPAYAFGRELALSDQFQNQDWIQVEPYARQSFEARNPGKWEEFKEAVRHGFDQTRSQLTTARSESGGGI